MDVRPDHPKGGRDGLEELIHPHVTLSHTTWKERRDGVEELIRPYVIASSTTPEEPRDGLEELTTVCLAQTHDRREGGMAWKN